MYYKVVSNRLESARCCVGDDLKSNRDLSKQFIIESIPGTVLVDEVMLIKEIL